MASRPASSPCDPAFGWTRHRVVPGDLGQPALQVADQLGVPGGLPGRRERVQVGELRPGHRLHLGGRVQLHRARAERDHRPVQRDVEVGQAAQVAQHGRLAAVLVEDRVGEEPRASGPGRPGSTGPDSASSPGTVAPACPAGQHRGHLQQLGVGGGLVAGDADRVRRRPGAGCSRPARARSTAAAAPPGQAHPDRVEEPAGRARPGRWPAAWRPAGPRGRCTLAAIAASPSGPWYTAYIAAITASSTCAVQMLLVAFSRRMCCSRACSASR